MIDYAVSSVSASSPDMGVREFAEFVEDIRANGQLVPIWIRGDEVIDGRKRLAACPSIRHARRRHEPARYDRP